MRLRDDRIEFVDVDGEVVVLDTAESLYYSVNETGVRLWLALRDGTTEQALQRLLVEENGISEEKAAADVTAFLDELDAAGLLDEA